MINVQRKTFQMPESYWSDTSIELEVDVWEQPNGLFVHRDLTEERNFLKRKAEKPKSRYPKNCTWAVSTAFGLNAFGYSFPTFELAELAASLFSNELAAICNSWEGQVNEKDLLPEIKTQVVHNQAAGRYISGTNPLNWKDIQFGWWQDYKTIEECSLWWVSVPQIAQLALEKKSTTNCITR